MLSTSFALLSFLFLIPTSSNKPIQLSAQEALAVGTCLDMIRNCQLSDGAFNQADHGKDGGAPAWIAPYFVNYAALALLAGHEHKKNPADLVRVGRWLDWCAVHQAEEGYWNDFAGNVANRKSNGKVDAWDSSGAMFLLVVGRYHRAGGKVSPEVILASKKALQCIRSVTDEDGLTWATPTYKVKFLMDNIEVYGGLRSGAEFFKAVGADIEAKQASGQADLIAKRLPKYWRPSEKLFAYALHQSGVFESGLEKAYPHGLAQLFGVSFIAPKLGAFHSAEKFSVDTGPLAAVGVERWLVAASRLGKAGPWRSRMVKEIAKFEEMEAYIYRPAVAALGLLEGAEWMPSLAGGE